MKGKKTEKGKFKTIKPDYWMGEDGKFWRKRTRAEAIAAFVPPNDTALGILWDNLAPFLKIEIRDPRL